MNQKLITKLLATLHEFAQKNQLSDAQLESLLGEIVLNSPAMRKGGVGLIDNETFVILNEERNAVLLAGRKWQGKKSSEYEVVLTDGHRVLSSVDVVDFSTLMILLFSPTEVRYINLSNNSGGKYLR